MTSQILVLLSIDLIVIVNSGFQFDSTNLNKKLESWCRPRKKVNGTSVFRHPKRNSEASRKRKRVAPGVRGFVFTGAPPQTLPLRSAIAQGSPARSPLAPDGAFIIARSARGPGAVPPLGTGAPGTSKTKAKRRGRAARGPGMCPGKNKCL